MHPYEGFEGDFSLNCMSLASQGRVQIHSTQKRVIF